MDTKNTLAPTLFPKRLHAIVAMGRNCEIGFRGDMPWHIPEDLKHFKEVTLGHPVIMGRSTWESLPVKPLPGRLNIVLTSQPDLLIDGALTAGSIQNAVNLCEGEPTPFIIGGGRVYREAMPMLSLIHVTRIEADFPDADTFFPGINPDEWILKDSLPLMTSRSGLKYRFETYERRHN